MRIGGYLDQAELDRCADEPSHLGERFRAIGFTAFDAKVYLQAEASTLG